MNVMYSSGQKNPNENNNESTLKEGYQGVYISSMT